MGKQLKDEELNNVSGGAVDYASPGPNGQNHKTHPGNLTGSAIRAVCATCNVEYIGNPSVVQSKVDRHLQETNHAYFAYYPYRP